LKEDPFAAELDKSLNKEQLENALAQARRDVIEYMMVENFLVGADVVTKPQFQRLHEMVREFKKL